MNPDVLVRAILAGILFATPLAFLYWLFKRRNPRILFHIVMIFISLFLFMAMRYYFTHLG